MKINIWKARFWLMVPLMFLVVMLLLALTACERPISKDSGAFSATLEPLEATLGPIEYAPTEIATVVSIPATATIEPLRLRSGVYLNWSKDADKYRQTDGTYLIPISDLQSLDSSASAILFEGEFYNTVGIHDVCYVTGGYVNGCKVVDGKIHINQGSFWGYRVLPNGEYLPDDLLAIFGHNKWNNWNDQNIKGNIRIHISTGTTRYPDGEEPKLTPAQKLISDQDILDRCSADKPQLLENPYGDSANQSDLIVVGAPGSFACRTLFVGKQTPEDNLVAYYWMGAKDGFSYVASATSFYIIPQSWGETEMKAFVATFEAKFLGQYTK